MEYSREAFMLWHWDMKGKEGLEKRQDYLYDMLIGLTEVMGILPGMLCEDGKPVYSHTERITMYGQIVSLIELLFPETASSVLLYTQILVANSLILAKTESRFYLIPLSSMAIDSLVYITGYAIAAFAVGIVRELLTYGTLFGSHICDALMPAAKSPFFGFFLLGLYAAACRHYYNRRRVKEQQAGKVVRKGVES